MTGCLFRVVSDPFKPSWLTSARAGGAPVYGCAVSGQPRSHTYRRYPEWLLGRATAGWNWQAEQAVLDVTHPGAEDHLRTVFTTLRGLGIDYFQTRLPLRRRDSG